MKNRIEEIADSVQIIALTGGGARMSFVRSIIQQVFPQTKIVVDSTPEFTITKGLARAGKLDLQSVRFLGELETVCAELPHAFKEEIGVFLKESIEPLANAFVNEVIRKGLIDWRKSRVRNLNRLEEHLEKLGKNWAESAVVGEIVKKATQTWTKQSLLHITPIIQDLTNRYNLPYESLVLSLDTVRPQKANVRIDDLKDSTVSDAGYFGGGLAAAIALKVSAIITPIILLILTKATIISSAMAGPIGWLIGGVIVVAGFLFGKDKAEEAVRDADLPEWVRTRVLSDDKIEAACSTSRNEIVSILTSEMAQAAENELSENAVQVVRKELEKKMKEAVVFIKS